jgi:hypothetical protein
MNSLVLELQRDALNPSTSILVLLRKALVVAKKLNIKEFQDWVEKELNGYPNGSELPKYRFILGELKAFNPYRGWIPFIIPLQIHELVSKTSVPEPISQIESLIVNTKDAKTRLVIMPPRLEHLLRSFEDIPYEIKIHIDRSQVHKVLEAVRDVVLKWSLKLEEDGILGEGISFSQEEKQIAAKHDYSSFIQINVGQSQMQSSSSESQSNSGSFNNDLRGANIANFANQLQDDARQVASNFSQNIGQNINEITRLVNSLREMAKEFPQAQRDEAMVHLDDLQEDITIPEKQKPQRIKTRIMALLAIAGTLYGTVAGVADFSNNVLELSEKLGIPTIEFSQPQPMQQLSPLKSDQPSNPPSP